MRDVMRFAAILSMAACGRIAFDPLTDTSRDSRPSDSTSSMVTYSKPIASRQPTNGNTDVFVIQAAQAGDAVLFHVACDAGAGTPTGYTATAPGWTFTALTSLANISGVYATTIAAIAPNSDPVTVNTGWQGGVTCTSYSVNADELSNVDPDSSRVFDASTEVSGSGDCTATITTQHDHDAIWAGCVSTSSTLAGGPGYVVSTDDGFGDMTEYKLTTDPAGTTETATFSNGIGKMFVMSMVAIKPR